jgi:hypothetical protein
MPKVVHPVWYSGKTYVPSGYRGPGPYVHAGYESLEVKVEKFMLTLKVLSIVLLPLPLLLLLI